METKRVYKVEIGAIEFQCDAALHYRFTNWARDQHIMFAEYDYTEFTDKSYSEEAIDSYGGDPKPETVKHVAVFDGKELKTFFNNLSYFSWKE